MITEVILRYYPSWKPPRDTGKEWIACLCPFHGESRASAGVSYELDKFRCFGCGVKGDIYDVIKHEEEVNYPEAQRIADRILSDSNGGVPPSAGGESGRGVPQKPGNLPGKRNGKTVSPGVRGRTTPWS